MPDPWTEAFAEAVASAPKDVIQHETLELQNPAFIEFGSPVAIRCVNDMKAKIFRIEGSAAMDPSTMQSFAAIPFEFGFPDISEGRGPEASVRVDNILKEIERYLDDALGLLSPITCIYRVYLSTDPNTVAFGPFKFTMREVQAVGSALEGSVTVSNPQNLKFLKKLYSMQAFPSLIARS